MGIITIIYLIFIISTNFSEKLCYANYKIIGNIPYTINRVFVHTTNLIGCRINLEWIFEDLEKFDSN